MKLSRKKMQVTPTLIVDDSLMIIKIIKKALLANDFDAYCFEEQSIFTASDGMEAFEIIGGDSSIKLIISDINMPNLNGDEFIEILQDTGKLEGLEVVFVTSSSTKLLLSPSIKEHILGIIYKPFRFDEFNRQLMLLQKKKTAMDIEYKRIKEIQVNQKKHIKRACVEYLKELDFTTKLELLSTLIDEIFGNDNISEDEFGEIIYAILSNYIFESGYTHTINNKRILCILKNFEVKVKIKENRFGLINGFKSQIVYVNSNELELKDVLHQLTTPLLDKISIAFIKAKNFPKLKSEFISPHFDYIVEMFTKIDCFFMDRELQKLLLEQKEIFLFNKWLYDFLSKNKLYKSVHIVSKSASLKSAVIKRLNLVYQRSYLLSEHYCGEIEFHIWSRAKSSTEISKYLKKTMPNTFLSSARFLLTNKRLSKEEHKLYLPYEKQTLFVVSTDLEILKTFKEIEDAPFDKWNFFCFAKLSLIDAWIYNNTPDKIIIDYSFSSFDFKDGVDFLKLLISKYPILEKIVTKQQVYIIANDKQLIELHKYKNSYNFSIIEKPLNLKNIYKTLLYN